MDYLSRYSVVYYVAAYYTFPNGVGYNVMYKKQKQTGAI